MEIMFAYVVGKWVFVGFAAWSTFCWHHHKYMYQKYVVSPACCREVEMENREAHIAIEPFLLAENNRAYLKRLVQNREWEKELMKDRDDWIPGTYFGEPVFHNKDFWNEMHQTEFNAHSNYVSLYVQNKWTNYRG